MTITTGQFNDSYFPIMDGVGMTAHNYARYLNLKYGLSFIVAPKVKGYEDLADYKVYRFKSVLLPGMNPYRIGLPLVDVKFKKKLKKERIDLIHAHCPFISGQLALKMARKQNIPLVATFHTKYREDFRKVVPNDHFVDFLVNLTLDFYHKADQVWVPNRSTGETLKAYGYKGNYEIMRNGTDMDVPGRLQLQNERSGGLALTGILPDEFVMLFVGQHRLEKNVMMIIEALRILHENGEQFRMVFVGEGYAMEEMKQKVYLYQMENKVLFMGVITDRKVLQQIFAASDLFVFPSVYDNSPLVIQEAAAYDVPSVVIRESSSAEGIEDGVNGFLTENHQEALAAVLTSLIHNPLRIRHAGVGARKSLHHPWRDIVDEVYQRYEELVKQRDSRNWRQYDDDEEPENETADNPGLINAQVSP